MIIDLNSSVIQSLKALHRERVINHKSTLFVLSGVYNAIAYKVANGEDVIQAEIANMVGVDRSTVFRAVKKLVDLGFLGKIKGKCFTAGGKVKREYSKYTLLVKSEYEVFKKKVVELCTDISRLIGNPIKKNSRKLFNCPCCKNQKLTVNSSKTRGYCSYCERVITPEVVTWFGYEKIKTKISKFFARKEWNVTFIELC